MAQELGLGDDSLIQKSVPKFRFQDSEKSAKKRILFLSPKLVKDAVHNIEENGFVKCLSVDGGNCPACNTAGNYRKARYGMHILEYVTDDRGNPRVPFSYAVKALVFAKSTAEKIQTLYQSMGDQFQKLDVLVSCESSTFQTINFTPLISGPSVFSQQTEELKQAMREDIKKQIQEINLGEIIAREVTPEVMADMLSGKVKNFPKKVDPNAPVQATAVVSPATAAQAALPLTQGVAQVPAALPVATQVAAQSVAPQPVAADAKSMMDDLSI
jgi:hypothetical protein